MKTGKLITRRNAILTGLVGVGGLALGRFKQDMPPTYGNLLRMGDNLTYVAHRTLLPGQSLVREYSERDLTSFPATGTIDPVVTNKPVLGDAYRDLRRGDFAGWRLSVEGRVAKPRSFSLSELKELPRRTQITRHTCEEGWTAIGQWTGVPLSLVLDAVGMLPTARFVVFTSYDDWVSGFDLLDALHPQTILAYGMNGKDLPIGHGAPLRLRVERQIGYKSVKFLKSIVVKDAFDDGGAKGDIQGGWAWYTGM